MLRIIQTSQTKFYYSDFLILKPAEPVNLDVDLIVMNKKLRFGAKVVVGNEDPGSWGVTAPTPADFSTPQSQPSTNPKTAAGFQGIKRKLNLFKTPHPRVFSYSAISGMEEKTLLFLKEDP